MHNYLFFSLIFDRELHSHGPRKIKAVGINIFFYKATTVHYDVQFFQIYVCSLTEYEGFYLTA